MTQTSFDRRKADLSRPVNMLADRRRRLPGSLDGMLRQGVRVSETSRFWATPMDVAEWLRGLGLEQYVPAFRNHDIDWDVLRRLTGEDLRELGVASIGHRRRLLDAIAALTDPQPVPKAPVAPVPAVGVAGIAERRQLTVMFSDLVDSTMLARASIPKSTVR